MQYLFYGLVAFASVIFFRVFLKTIKHPQPGGVKQDQQTSLAAFTDLSVPLSDGRVRPLSGNALLSQERALTSLNICVGQKMEVSRPKNIWHIKERQTLVPSMSLLFSGEEVEMSLAVDSEPYCRLWARAVRRAVQLPDKTVTVKGPARLTIQDGTERIENCRLCATDEALEIEIPEAALRLTLRLDASTRAALETLHESLD